MNPFFQWDRFLDRPVIVDGLLITLKVAAGAALLGPLGVDRPSSARTPGTGPDLIVATGSIRR